MELVGDGRSAGQCGVRRPVRDTATSEPRETDSCHTCILGREKLLYEGGVSIAEVSHVMWATVVLIVNVKLQHYRNVCCDTDDVRKFHVSFWSLFCRSI